MGYSASAVQMLTSWLGSLLPEGGAILELGEQQISAGVPEVDIRNLLLKTLGHREVVESVLQERFIKGRRRIADAFAGSAFFYRCVDLFEGEMVLTADLNKYIVTDEWKNRFDVVTNFGTSEHIADQINCFRAVHDFTRVAGLMVHNVPFCGYYNHGLFNYHPAFFILLADANGYEIEALNISPPHLPFTIPNFPAMPGTATWNGIRHKSGILSAHLRKMHGRPFTLFTDYDVTAIGARSLAEPWASLMMERYDLRVREP